MVDKVKVLNFMQDFGCAKIEHLQILFNDKNNNFKNILDSNMVSKKNDIFVHNTKRIDERMLIALDILCKYKPKLKHYYLGYDHKCTNVEYCIYSNYYDLYDMYYA